ncbi:Wall-associated receptor kinase-like 8 [Morella rubra]|uniref:Wall-associated receptor kinase-like 8 n=1 Tax=Morella rubra TaxID=262757 RepID=A0A6A1UQV6_9ROSI|nr:Wall-associated receptor kinase-like 8 [Morella rubra]
MSAQKYVCFRPISSYILKGDRIPYTCTCYPGYEGNPFLPEGCHDIDECASYQEKDLCGGKRCIITGPGGLLLLLGGWFLYKAVKKRRIIKTKEKFFKRNGGLLLQQQLSSREGNVENTKLFSSNDLENATDTLMRIEYSVKEDKLLTGEKAISSTRALEAKSLATYFIQAMEDNNLLGILDKRVMKEAKKQEIVAVANLAKRCLNLKGRKRPTMREISMEFEAIQMLRKAANDQQNNEVVEDVRIERYGQFEFLSTLSMSVTNNGTATTPLLSSESG